MGGDLMRRLQVLIPALVIIGAVAWCILGDCALLTEDQRGYRSFAAGDYEEAEQSFVDPFWRGLSLYRSKDFEAAAQVFAGIDAPDAAFAQGNALVFLGRYDEAVARYDRALQLRPGWEDAAVNRDIAVARAALLAREGGDMTGGMLGADDIDFSDRKSPDTGEAGQVEQSMPMGEADMRAIWLRQVRTRPADFLRWKFAWQESQRGGRE
jgi:Ca-activated chloride channel family protein